MHVTEERRRTPHGSQPRQILFKKDVQNIFSEKKLLHQQTINSIENTADFSTHRN